MYIIHRRDEFRASKVMQQRALEHAKIKVSAAAAGSAVCAAATHARVRGPPQDCGRACSALPHTPCLRALRRATPQVLWDSVVEEAYGNERGLLGGVKVRNVKTGATTDVPLGGLFFAIGHEPATAFLAGQLALDAAGYIVTAPDSTATSVPGVFAAGDVQDSKYRQAITAAGSGEAGTSQRVVWRRARGGARPRRAGSIMSRVMGTPVRRALQGAVWLTQPAWLVARCCCGRRLHGGPGG